jgi:hypothetical protein
VSGRPSFIFSHPCECELTRAQLSTDLHLLAHRHRKLG